MISEGTRVEVRDTSSDGLGVERRVDGDGQVIPTRRLAGVTVADGLMVLVGLAAAVARLGGLSALPLSPAEAGPALASWQFTNGIPLTAAVSSPAYFSLTNLIMGLGVDGDAAARLVPALIGVLTVWLPWLWRGRTHPAVWLTAAIFLAVSPLQMAVSRTAGGEAIALFALTLLAVATFRLEEGEWWGAAAGLALGLGLTSAPLFYTGMVAFIPAWWVFGGARAIERRTWGRLAIAGGLTFVVAAATGLFYLSGVGAALQLFPAWLAQFGLPVSSWALAVMAPVLTLLRYEPALLFLGVPAAVWVMAGDERPGKLFSLWLVLLLPILLLQAEAFQNAVAAIVPGYLLVGLLAGDLAIGARPRAERRTTWLVAGGLTLLGMVLLVSLSRFTRLGLWSGGEAPLVGLAVLAFVFAGVAVILALAWDNAAARRGAFLGVAVLLLYWQWGTGWQLAHQGANDPRERWVVAGTDDDMAVLATLLERVSLQAANSNTDLEVFSTVESPALRWYFRDFGRFTTGPALPLETQAAVLITANDAEPRAPNEYLGADFGLVQRDVPGNEGARPALAELLRWWLLREASTASDQERVIVWIRSDLAAER